MSNSQRTSPTGSQHLVAYVVGAWHATAASIIHHWVCSTLYKHRQHPNVPITTKSQATIDAHQMTRPAQPAEANKPRCQDPLQEEEIKQWHTACLAAVDAVLRLEMNPPPGSVLGGYRQVAPFILTPPLKIMHPNIRGTSGLCTTEVPGQSHGQKPHHKATSLCTHPQANKPHASKHQEKPYKPLRANDR